MKNDDETMQALRLARFAIETFALCPLSNKPRDKPEVDRACVAGIRALIAIDLILKPPLK